MSAILDKNLSVHSKHPLAHCANAFSVNCPRQSVVNLVPCVALYECALCRMHLWIDRGKLPFEKIINLSMHVY